MGVGWAQSVREVHSKGGGGNAISSSIGSVARVRGGGGGGRGTLKARLSCEALPICLFNYGILGIKNLIVKYNGYFFKIVTVVDSRFGGGGGGGPQGVREVPI